MILVAKKKLEDFGRNSLNAFSRKQFGGLVGNSSKGCNRK
jgi:hypothetical protein